MNRIKIRQWMIGAEITQAQIGREAGVTRTLVNHVISGKPEIKFRRKDSKVRLIITLLKGHGCPREYLETGPPQQGDQSNVG